MKLTILSVLLSGALVVGAVVLSSGSSGGGNQAASADNVSERGGKQVISVTAKGGYAPRFSSARAGVPSVLRVETRGTFDCSSALSIPSLRYRAYLPPSGVTEIEVPPQKAGSVLQGLCAMGMYSFAIEFK